MTLTPAQLTSLKQDIAADAALSALPQTSDTAFEIARVYNLLASPTFWVYRTELGEKEVYEATSPDGTTWDWTTYIAQNQREADAWTRMFSGGGRGGGGAINPSLAQVRAGVDKIFSGVGAGPTAQRTHLHSLFRRTATRAEKLFATTTQGAGTTAAPATLTFTGTLTGGEVEQAWAR
jgi:hypothetical protein